MEQGVLTYEGLKRKATARAGLSQDVVRKIVKSVESLRFGYVTVVVQDGKVIQIEKTEKMRLV